MVELELHTLTARSRDIAEKLTFPQVAEEFTEFYGNLKFKIKGEMGVTRR
jgi:hypothetical protein